jgi:hypothetical protein
MNFIIGKCPKKHFLSVKKHPQKERCFLNQRERNDYFSPESKLKLMKGKGEKIARI